MEPGILYLDPSPRGFRASLKTQDDTEYIDIGFWGTELGLCMRIGDYEELPLGPAEAAWVLGALRLVTEFRWKRELWNIVSPQAIDLREPDDAISSPGAGFPSHPYANRDFSFWKPAINRPGQVLRVDLNGTTRFLLAFVVDESHVSKGIWAQCRDGYCMLYAWPDDADVITINETEASLLDSFLSAVVERIRFSGPEIS